ncbi:MAG TPA: hypothetical protein VK465_09995 [Fibrobacteria bacterium]|nr:hypothetical protein [Fibrobacteria bacterium]
MEQRTGKHSLFLLCLASFLMAGCFTASEAPSEASAGKGQPVDNQPTNNQPTNNQPTNNQNANNQPTNHQNASNPGGGWDDFPNKYKPTLLDLDSKVSQLPAPLGTRYEFLNYNTNTGAKIAAKSQACTGDSTVFQYRNPARNFFLYDTITYFDSKGIAYCDNPNGGAPRWSVRHSRRIVEFEVGEAWETIHDSVSEGDVLPRHTIHGTGFIRLDSGLELRIQSYDLILLTPHSQQQAYVINASLKLLYKDVYAINLDLVKQHPYSVAEDFFPAETGPEEHLILSGPITHPSDSNGVDTVGYFDLRGDRSVSIRDWTGAPVKP